MSQSVESLPEALEERSEFEKLLWIKDTLKMCAERGYRITPVYKSGKSKPYADEQTYHEFKHYKDAKHIGVCLDDSILVDYDGNKAAEKGAAIISVEELAQKLGLDEMPEPIQINTNGDSIHWLFRVPENVSLDDLKQSADGWLDFLDIKTGNQLMHLKAYKSLTGGALPEFDEIPLAPAALLDALKKTQKPSDAPKTTPKHDDIDLSEAREILSYINPEIARDEWVKVLAGIKVQFPDRDIHIELANQWSRGDLFVTGRDGYVCPSYKSIDDVETTIGSLNRLGSDTVTWPTVCHMARESGANLSAIAKKHKGEDSPDEAANKEEFTFVSGDELARNAKAPEFLIDGILEKGSHGLLAGESQSYKSFLAIRMAYSICTGQDFFDHTVYHRGPVAYICGEGQGGLGRRLKAHVLELGGFGDGFQILNGRLSINNGGQMEGLAEALTKIKPVLVIFDTFASLTAGVEENSNSEVSDVLNNVTSTCQRLGASSMIVHHFGKDSSKLVRGASAFLSNADFLFKMKRESDNTTTLSCLKMKDGEPFKDIVLSTKTVDLEITDQEGKPCTSLILTEPDTRLPPTFGIEGWSEAPGEAQQAAAALYAVFDQKRQMQAEGSGLPTVTSTEWKAEAEVQGPKNFWRGKHKAIEQNLVEHIEGKGYRPKIAPNHAGSFMTSTGGDLK
ncbi:AAA family ATPase [Neptuniibacter sp.]|uniref:AAA family ATPase n=1 Tax=Neptuniibacter sp. TaxID=1962643 RepID=UPI003B58DE64